jgi:hypothetical protein
MDAMAKNSSKKGGKARSAARSSTGWKIYSTGLTAVAGIAGRKALSTAWKLVAGKDPPLDPGHPDVSLAEATTWAAISGATAGLARMSGARRAAAWWTRASGAPPPGYEDSE